MTVRLVLFGSPVLHLDGESIALPFERRNQLLAFLALKRSWVGRAELAAMLWPEQETKLAYTNLRKTLFRLQAFAWAEAIESQGSSLRFEVDTDVQAFEQALKENLIPEALALRRGPLLAGFDDDRSEAWSNWLAFERDRLRFAWRGAALDRLAGALEPAEAVDLSARLLDDDPLDEAALRVHMAWLERGGQASRARQAYREFVERLATDLGLAPSAELRALHDALGSAAPLPPQATPAPTASDEGFVGHTVELRQIAELFAQDDCRLVTLTGPGGVGKTRLAQRALRELAPGYAHGGAFVPLEDMATASELGGRLARELGVTLGGSAEPLAQVTRFLHERAMLLVLDNFEHLASAAPLLEDLLRACPQVRVIVTSRVRLGLGGEWLVPVEGLTCPEAEDHDVIEAFDAVRMFVQAARRVEPAFVAAVEADAIIEICRQVDGLPLALQLAAAWTRVLSCDAIADELRRGTELLHAAADVPSQKHAGIDVVFEHSWRLLTPAERDVLVRLSVFREGFTPAAARAVAAASLPVLGALTDKSLLRKSGPRAFLHPLVQQFAAARLGQGDARTATEAAHAQYFVLLMSQLRRGIESGDRDTMRQMDAEFENCKAAWQWTVAHEAGDEQLQCMPALIDYCDHRCRFAEALQLVRLALEAPGVRAHPVLHARLLARVAHFEYRLNRYADAEAAGLRALDAARSTRDYAARILSTSVLGSCALRVGRYEDALRRYREVQKFATARNDQHNIATSLDHIALVLKWLGRYDEALRMSLESIAAHRRLGDVAGEALCLNNHAALHIAKQEFASAAPYLREALALCDREGLVSTRLYVLANLTEVTLKSGDPAGAEGFARRAIELALGVGNRPVVAWMKLQLARLALRRNDLPAARTNLAESLDMVVALAQQVLRIGGVMIFAEVLEHQGEVEAARQVLAFAAQHPSASVPDRDEILGQLASLAGSGDAPASWPAIELDELINRIVAEANLGYAPLLAALRAARS